MKEREGSFEINSGGLRHPLELYTQDQVMYLRDMLRPLNREGRPRILRLDPETLSLAMMSLHINEVTYRINEELSIQAGKWIRTQFVIYTEEGEKKRG